MKTNLFGIAMLATAAATSAARATDYAAEVVSYDNSQSGSYNNPQVVLGRPSIDTQGDFSMFEDIVAVVPVFGPWRNTEIYRVGTGTSLVVKFDHPVLNDPLNPCRVDFIIFGNTIQSVGSGQYWRNGDPNLTFIQSTLVTAEPAIVSVSQDGQTWSTFVNGPFADDFAPTLGRIYDPANYDPLLENNLWWGSPTIPTYPLNPAFGPQNLLGLSVAQAAMRYGWSAGGTGFDLSNLDPPLAWMQYVRVQHPGTGLTPEIDAFADVAALAFPDFDCDSDIDHDDFVVLDRCLTGPNAGPPAAGCERADLDRDGDVDQSDFGMWQRCARGPGARADFNCMNGP
ncbi:MAG TPA: hypothetical protein VLM89_11590 [Phycisphaerae bacterium]|nr:hypothetical protein [Phycisphaerae bacterium]